MKFTGEALLEAPVEQVWASLLDPAVLVRTIPGCERLVTTDENVYDMTVTTGVAAIRGTYAGSWRLSDMVPHESLVVRVDGAGAPGTVSATVDVGFADAGGATRLTYDADAVVGGMVGGVGQRMLTSVSRRMAAEFFGNVNSVLTGAPVGAVGAPGVPAAGPQVAPTAAPVPGQVFTAPPSPPRALVGSPDDFVKGLVVGAGLVLLGVVAGGVFGRRR